MITPKTKRDVIGYSSKAKAMNEIINWNRELSGLMVNLRK
tara:strand:- start:307 stop:426 length:120 start_codon:yes stop_codon:yes gene_type:complete